MTNIRKSFYWTTHFLRNAPSLFVNVALVATLFRVSKTQSPKILIGTHHKILTVFFGRVFKIFSIITNRTISRGRGNSIDYNNDIIIDHHSDFIFDRIKTDVCGIHVRRDPRDLLVSSAFYHQKSNEDWLHVPQEQFGGLTYQEKIKSIDTMEDKLLFEIENSSGEGIRSLLRWRYESKNFYEAKYEDLVSENGDRVFAAIVQDWSITEREKRLLVGLFRYFSIGNPGFKGNKHARNPEAGQWRRHFTPKVEKRFAEVFPDALARLGYAA